jgi:hypothetical protein
VKHSAGSRQTHQNAQAHQKHIQTLLLACLTVVWQWWRGAGSGDSTVVTWSWAGATVMTRVTGWGFSKDIFRLFRIFKRLFFWYRFWVRGVGHFSNLKFVGWVVFSRKLRCAVFWDIRNGCGTGPPLKICSHFSHSPVTTGPRKSRPRLDACSLGRSFTWIRRVGSVDYVILKISQL